MAMNPRNRGPPCRLATTTGGDSKWHNHCENNTAIVHKVKPTDQQNAALSVPSMTGDS